MVAGISLNKVRSKLRPGYMFRNREIRYQEFLIPLGKTGRNIQYRRIWCQRKPRVHPYFRPFLYVYTHTSACKYLYDMPAIVQMHLVGHVCAGVIVLRIASFPIAVLPCHVKPSMNQLTTPLNILSSSTSSLTT
jgi:hypothetical protein